MTREQSKFLIDLELAGCKPLANFIADRFDKGETLQQAQDSIRRAMDAVERSRSFHS